MDERLPERRFDCGDSVIFHRLIDRGSRFQAGEDVRCKVIRYGLRRDGKAFYTLEAVDKKRYPAGVFTASPDNVRAEVSAEPPQ